ncbi:MAG: hypothetical protein CL707_09485 [Chloroflexi bacterium]|nr:hypothetical protein [Chloroflexota bacterium]
MKDISVKQLPSSSKEKDIWPYQNKYPDKELSLHESEFLLRKDLPLITVITPSFNQGAFIEQTIRSVLLQNYPRVEYFVMDGGSTDNTKSVLEKYSPWITEWKSENDKGQSDAINKGFAKSTGDVVAWINADDIYRPNAFLLVAKAMIDNPSAGLFYGDWSEINSEGIEQNTFSPKIPSVLNLLFAVKSYVAQPALFFRRTALEEVGFVDENLHMVMDFELLLRLLSKYEPAQVNKILASYRVHPDTKTNTMDLLAWQEREIVFRRSLSSNTIHPDAHNYKSEIMSVFFRRAAYEHFCSLRVLEGLRSICLSLFHNPVQVLDLRLWAKFFSSS